MCRRAVCMCTSIVQAFVMIRLQLLASRNANPTYVYLQYVTEEYTRPIRDTLQSDSLIRLAIQSLEPEA
jgi:hypothetical protein